MFYANKKNTLEIAGQSVPYSEVIYTIMIHVLNHTVKRSRSVKESSIPKLFTR